MESMRQRLYRYPYTVQEAARLQHERRRVVRLARRVRLFHEPTGWARLVRLQKRLEENLRARRRDAAATRRLIERLPDARARELCRLRVLQGLSWDAVAEQMHYDLDAKGVFKLYNKALAALEKQAER